MALPILMKGMEWNASSPEGTAGLLNALNNKHDGSILDNLSGLFNGGVDDSVKQDGAGILGHILGGKQSGVQQVIGQISGLDADTVGNILKIAAPLVMGYLGKQKNNQNIASSGDLTRLLGGLLGSISAKSEQNFLEQILDANGDGSAVDDVAGMLLGGKKNSWGGLGGMLGGLFGK